MKKKKKIVATSKVAASSPTRKSSKRAGAGKPSRSRVSKPLPSEPSKKGKFLARDAAPPQKIKDKSRASFTRESEELLKNEAALEAGEERRRRRRDDDDEAAG